EVIEVEVADRFGLKPPEREQAVGERGGVPCRAERHFHDLGSELAPAAQELEVAHDHLQVIVEVVGDRGGNVLKLRVHPGPSYRIKGREPGPKFASSSPS